MCGVAGILGELPSGGDLRRSVERMVAVLDHRGPDDRGAWCDPEAGVALGHARLSILDLSPAGHQPMESACGQYVLSFNGEIYNFRELRSGLEAQGSVFRGASDTEVLLAAISRGGLDAALERAVGMFALALWDRRTRTLHLARDRFGEKPLYYARSGNAVLFASEAKAFLAVPGFAPRVSRPALALMLRFGYVPSPHCIYEGAFKVAPGESLAFPLRDRRPGEPQRRRYWDLGAAAREGLRNPFAGTLEEAVAALKGKLGDAVERQMVADVPLGAFLSGGIDSSLITALMQSRSPRKVKTFSIGFEPGEFDEAAHAKAVASRLGTEHTEFYVTAAEALEAIPRMPGVYDEPFADSSQIPTYILCRLARRDVTVALTGDGGDELFYGYSRYFRAARIRPLFDRLPAAARRSLRSLSRAGVGGSGGSLASLLPGRLGRGLAGVERRARLALELGGRIDPAEFYRDYISLDRDPESLLEGEAMGEEPLPSLAGAPPLPGLPEMMMYADTLQYLPDDILVKVDRAGMAVSLETRVPLLDHRVCEFAWSLPFAYRYGRPEGGKRILKRLLSEYLPRELIDRPKQGFGVPLSAWLRGPLRDWAESLLAEGPIRESGLLRPQAVRALWDGFIRGRTDRSGALWSILMFQGWLGAVRASASAPGAPLLSTVEP